MILPALFMGLVAAAWLPSFGYVLFLMIAARRRGAGSESPTSFPLVAVVIPTLNEAPWIDRKLDNLRGLDYPSERLRVLVVDGGSEDGTTNRVSDRIRRGEAIRLIETGRRGGKAAQLNRAFAELEQQFIVVTDADTELEPACVAALVAQLESDPMTGIVGAVVCPRTELVEEQVHWAFLNWIWWLEGEAWSAPGLSGVCYAVRRSAFSDLAQVEAEDIHLALHVAARGFRVRICPRARALELRVPQTAAGFLQFRRRRGGRYLAALSHPCDENLGPRVWRAARWVRRGQMTWLAHLVAGVVLLAGALIASRQWRWPAAAAVWLAFSWVPLLLATHRSPWYEGEAGLLRWGWAGIRCFFLTLASLLLMRASPLVTAPTEGDRRC